MRISDWSSDVCSSDLFRAGRLVEEGHGSPVATPAAGELHFRPFLDQMIIAPPIGYKITDRPDLQPVLLREGVKIIHSRHCTVIFHVFADDTGVIGSAPLR